MNKVYVAGPYSADNVMDVLTHIRDGINAATRLMEDGWAVYCPWLDHHFVLQSARDIPKEAFIQNSMEWLKVSDVVLVIGDYEKSTGTVAEICEAHKRNIPVVYSIAELYDWLHGYGKWTPKEDRL